MFLFALRIVQASPTCSGMWVTIGGFC